MIRIEYRSSSYGNPTKVIIADLILEEGIGRFQAWKDDRPIFIGRLDQIISEEEIDEDEHLVDRAEGQGD